jgi:RNA polymerase sigma-70 factor (ECF subfamily)
MQAGEGAALEELWRRYAGLLYTQALRVLHNPSEAEDVVVEVFSEAWKRSSTYHPERARPVAWLVTLVRRRAIDHLRERRSHERAEARLALDGEGGPQGAADGDHSEEMVRLAELRWLLDQALRRLPQNQRETVCMVYFEGLTQKEIAARTKTPLGTVKTRLELGMRKLRDRIRCTRLHSAGLFFGE